MLVNIHEGIKINFNRIHGFYEVQNPSTLTFFSGQLNSTFTKQRTIHPIKFKTEICSSYPKKFLPFESQNSEITPTKHNPDK